MLQQLYKKFQDWSAKGTIWVISDTHFEDQDMLDYFSYPDAETMVKYINKFVGKHDTLIHLGDVGTLDYINNLRGYKVLICGNHDKGHTKYEAYFNEVYDGPLMIGPKLLLSHEPIDETYALNLHGHDHSNWSFQDDYHLNCCANNLKFKPVSLNRLMTSGVLNKINSIHRQTIDKAIEKSKNK